MGVAASKDFLVSGGPGSSVYLLIPISQPAKDWVADNLPPDALGLGRGIAVEWRYLDNIVAGIEGDGLSVAAA